MRLNDIAYLYSFATLPSIFPESSNTFEIDLKVSLNGTSNTNFSDIRNAKKNNADPEKQLQKKIDEKLKKNKYKLKNRNKEYQYLIKYDNFLASYYIEVLDPNTKRLVKTIPPSFILKVERKLKKFLELFEKLENLKNLKVSKNPDLEKIDKCLQDIKNLFEDLDLSSDEIKEILSNYTTEYVV